MKKILIVTFCMASMFALAQAPIQRQAFTTNILPATIDTSASTIHNTLIDSTVTGDSSGETNTALRDGGSPLVVAGVTSSAWGSSNGMNPNAIRTIFFANGSTSGYAAGNDPANIAVNESTNFNDSGGGWGVAVMGGGNGSTLGANIISLVGGATAVGMPSNRVEFLSPGWFYSVFNSDPISGKGIGWSSPGYNDAASLDTGNYFGWLMDGEHGFVGAPWESAATAGNYQPDAVVYQFTVSGVTTAPTLVGNSVYSNNGHYYTAYSNNISAGSGSLMMVGSYGAPATSGNLTKVNGIGDSTIAFSATNTVRTWIWGFRYRPSTATINVYSNITAGGGVTISNGTFQSQLINSDANGVNPFITSRLTYLGGNLSGMAIQDNGAVESVSFGGRGHYIASGNSGSSADLWYSTPTFDIGGDELANFNNRGSSELMVNGSLGLRYTNTAANYNVTVQDGVATIKGSGAITATLPDASSHAKGRIAIIKNTGTTNSLIATTSAQTIDGKTSTTNSPNETLGMISDGSNWQILFEHGGAPTNFFAMTTSGFTNTTPWQEVAYVTGTAVTITNFLSTGQAYMTNTTLVNAVLTIDLMPGDSIVGAAAAGLGGTVRALRR